jgi:hypothetical protein
MAEWMLVGSRGVDGWTEQLVNVARIASVEAFVLNHGGVDAEVRCELTLVGGAHLYADRFELVDSVLMGLAKLEDRARRSAADTSQRSR